MPKHHYLKLKVARLRNDPEHEDSKVDIIGYTLLMERLRESIDK